MCSAFSTTSLTSSESNHTFRTSSSLTPSACHQIQNIAITSNTSTLAHLQEQRKQACTNRRRIGHIRTQGSWTHVRTLRQKTQASPANRRLKHTAARWRPQPSDDPQHGALAASTGAHNHGIIRHAHAEAVEEQFVAVGCDHTDVDHRMLGFRNLRLRRIQIKICQSIDRSSNR